MKANIHKSNERGIGDHGWRKSFFSFSFGNYFNQRRMGFGVLRALNDEIIEPTSGLPRHPHDNIEIVTIVMKGKLENKDSSGNGSVIKSNEVQKISAGTGISHSEWNPSDNETLKMFQIWVEAKNRDIKPDYEQMSFDFKNRKGELITIVSGEEEEEGLTFHQDAWIKRGILTKKQDYKYDVKDYGNLLFLFVISGSVKVGKTILKDGDSAEIYETSQLLIHANEESDILLFELPER